MAYIGQTASGEDYYNVNFAVGNQSPNKRDDVYLVQWMLHRIYTDHPLFIPPENKDLSMDGWIGPKTIKWIKAFQTDVNRLGQTCVADGRVDSARKQTGAVSKTVYTMLWLNGALRSANPTVFFDPASDPSIPPQLLSALASGNSSSGPFIADIPVPASGGI